MAMLVAPLSVLGVGCSDDDASSSSSSTTSAVELPASSSSPGTQEVSIELVGPAVAALEAARGGPQRYTEINVQVGLVNLFVALDDGTELAYVFRDGALEEPESPQAQPDGAVAFELPGNVLGTAATVPAVLSAELPDSRLVGLSLGVHAGDGVGWLASVLSAEGGIIDVLIDPAGTIVGAAPR